MISEKREESRDEGQDSKDTIEPREETRDVRDKIAKTREQK